MTASVVAPHISTIAGSLVGSGVTGFSGGSSGNNGLVNEIELSDHRSRYFVGGGVPGNETFDNDSDYFDDYSSEND